VLSKSVGDLRDRLDAQELARAVVVRAS